MSKRNPTSPAEKERRRARKARGDKKKTKRRQKKSRERARRSRNPDDDDIRDTLEDKLNEHANIRFSEGLSYVGDQDMIDADDQSYQGDTLVKIAYVGDEVTVDSDVLVSPGWYEILKLKGSEHAQLWSEAETEDERYNAAVALELWLQEKGFEKVSHLSRDWPSDASMELQLDHIYDAVARELSVSEDEVQRVAEAEFGDAMRYNDTLIYWYPDNGEVQAYALPEGAERVANPFTWADDYPKSSGALGAALGSLAGVALAVMTAPNIAGILSVLGGSMGAYYGVPEDRRVRGAWGGGIGGVFGPVGAAVGGAVAGRKPGEKARKNNPTNELKRKLLR